MSDWNLYKCRIKIRTQGAYPYSGHLVEVIVQLLLRRGVDSIPAEDLLNLGRGGSKLQKNVTYDHLQNGKYALLEVKLGGETLIEEGAKTLKTVLRRIDTGKMGEPSFMAVITGTERYAYRRDDGILVIPIGALRN